MVINKINIVAFLNYQFFKNRTYNYEKEKITAERFESKKFCNQP